MRLSSLIAFCGLACCVTAHGATIEVGPEASSSVRAVADLDAQEIEPGSVVRLHAGHYASPIVIPLTGTAAAPIIIEGAGDGGLDLDGPIVLDHAAFVVVKALRISHAADAAIILREGSHDIVVQGNTIADARLGIWIGQHAGDANRVEGNEVRESVTHGIAVDGVNGEPGRETIISGNRIVASGIHGIEISGNFAIIDGNHVSGSGRLSTGASGIHIFAKDANQGVGQHNVIRNNVTFDNHDASAQDGNGIQLDQWCDDNLVTNNIAADNDGAGISVFDAGQSRIIGNTLVGNMRDPGHSHRHKGDLVFATDDEHDADHTRNGAAERNIVVTKNQSAAPVLVDAPTAQHPPRFSGNLFWKVSGDGVARWAGRDIALIAAWNALAPHGEPDITGDPDFAASNAGGANTFVPGRSLPNLGARLP